MNTPTNPFLLGARVKYAREKLGLNQDDLRAALGFNGRQTISDIEKGKRAVRADELLALSEALDQDIEFFIDPFTVVAEAQYSWRAKSDVSQSVLDQFEVRANGWVGMLRFLREMEPSSDNPLKFSLRLDAQSSFEKVQRHAESLVQKLKLGPVPALNIVESIERELDVPILFIDMNKKAPAGAISGAACHLAEFGVILVNLRESEARRHFNLAHELFHILTWEAMSPSHRESNSARERTTTQRVEHLADNFAAAFLMPRFALDSLIDPVRSRDALHLAEVAEELRVTTCALGWRLLNLRLIDEATRLNLEKQKRRDKPAQVPKPFSSRFITRLGTALEEGRLSARKAAKALGMSLFELSETFVQYDMPAPFEL